MKLLRMEESAAGEAFSLPLEAFDEPVKVQGGTRRCAPNALYIESGGRYKLFTQTVDRIKILEGEGHFKWARGEMKFTAGDVFRLEQTGEYEVNGKCVFLVVRS